MDIKTEKREYILTIIMGAVIFVITHIIVMKELELSYTDYSLHLELAEGFRTLVPYHITYPLWHFLVYAVYKAGWYLLGNMPAAYACAFVTSAVNTVVFLTIRKIADYYRCPKSSLAAFGLCLVMPVYIPWYNERLYVGQWSPVTWHNPTNMIVKPFALAAFFLVVIILEKLKNEEKVQRKEYIRLGAMVFFSVLAKPSFFQGFVPALGIYMFIILISRKFRKCKGYLLTCLAFVPGFLIILAQFFFTFYTGSGEGVAVGWFEVMIISPNPWISTFLAIMFPVCFIALNFRKCLKLTQVKLSALYTVVSWLEFALLYEQGARKYHANFSWALQVSYTILWVVTSILLFRDMKEMDMTDTKRKVKNTVLFVIWLLHLICGCYYAFSLMTVPDMWF